ncbi:hypothetical protein B7P43_G01860 [Cryptotermes secundus]|uniref:Uncharacterized protein n=1 Tax=Cryptotermes secundus TaxID=105785 RepID=A0A2J7QWI1_9NEOP|nr:hypothetical protein B7P43_G01860 [Cryptotermes secundus]PNF32942.1 hypothetical protein B7P43_G01860 [Cryptotermes secundus]
MANEAGEHELGCAVEKKGEGNEVSKGKENDSESNTVAEKLRKYSEEDSVEQAPNMNSNIGSELNVRNSNVIIEDRDTDDAAGHTSDKTIADEMMSDAIDEPPDSFFDDVLTDDFLDSLAVVDAWDPDAEDGYESLAETKREDDGNNRQSPAENKTENIDKTVSRDSENKSKSDRSCHRSSGDHSSRTESRRHDKVSVMTKQNSKERTAHRKDKNDTHEHTHSVDKDIQKGYKRTRDRSRERRKEYSSNNKERNTSRIRKGSRDHIERSIHRRGRNSKDRSAERNIHSYSNNQENKDKSMETSVNKRQRDGSVEGAVENDDKNKNIMRTSHRYSYQFRVSNRGRTAGNSAKKRNSDLRHDISDVCAGEKPGAVQRRQESSREFNRREEGLRGSHRNEKNSDLNLAYKESHREYIKNYHVEKGTSDVVIEGVAASQQYVITKRDNPPLNDTKLDTCIKELADLVPPGTENDFILATKDEPVKVVDDIKKIYIRNVKAKHDCKTVRKESLSEETKHSIVLGSEKSCRHPMVKSERHGKEICIINEKNDGHKILERNEKEKASLCIAGQEPHREATRVNSPHERKRRRSGSSRSERRSSASRSRGHGPLDEERGRKQLKSSSEEKKRRSSSLERMFEASRTKNEQFNELLRKKRVLGYGGEENILRSRSRERWQASVDAQRLNRKVDVENNSRRYVRSLSREKQHESSLPLRLSRSRSRDREHRNEYRDRRERYRNSLSQEEEKQRSLMKNRRSPSWQRNKHRALSPLSAGHMSLSPSISFELSSVSEREPKRRFSRSLSRERRSYEYRRSYRDSCSPHSNGSAFSPSDSFVSLSSVSDDSRYRRRRKRSPFWKELERQFSEDLRKSFYTQSGGYSSSAAGTAHLEGRSSSNYPAQGTTALPYPPDHTVYSHNYPSEPGFSGALIQHPQNDVPPTFVSAPSLHHEPPSVPPVMAPTSVPLPVPPPVYNVPPPVPTGYPGQLAPFISISEFPSTENTLSQPFHYTEKDSPQVPPPPKISQPGDGKQMSLSSLLEASVKVGGSAERKAMSVDPVLVARCEEAIHTYEENDRVILVSPGHLVLQESSKPHSSAEAVMQASLEDAKFRSPILRTPDPQLSFTTPPVHDDVTSKPLRHLPKKGNTVSVKGEPETRGAPFGRSTDNSELCVDASTRADSRDNEKKGSKRQKCVSCLERMNRIMVWNSTQTPPNLDISDKIMVWNSTQTPRKQVKHVGIQVQIVKLRRLRKWVAQKERSHKLHAVNVGDDVKSDATAVYKRSSPHSNPSKTQGSFSDITPTVALKEYRNQEAAAESRQQAPEQSGFPASSNNEGGHRGRDSFYKPPYQVCVSSHGQSSFSHYSSGRSDMESAVSSAISQRSVHPKGILKGRSDLEVQPPAPAPQMPWQQSSSLRNCDFPEYSALPPHQASQPFTSSGGSREFGRSCSNTFGGMGPNSPMQPTSSNAESMFGSTAASFPKFGNPDIGSTPHMDQNFYGLHHNQFPLLRGSGNPGAGLGMQPIQHQSSMVFRQVGNPPMMPHDPDIRY